MAASLVSEAMAIFAKTKDTLPCSRLALTAHDFSGLVSGRGSIASFLRVLPPLVESPSPQSVDVMPKVTPALDPSPRRGDGRSLSGVEASGVEGGQNSCNSNRGRREATAEPGSSSSFNGSRGGGDNGGDNGSVWGSDTRRSRPAGASHCHPRPGAKVCPKCGKMLAEEEDLQEHLDFHYAEGLQERYAREGGVAQGAASVVPDRGGGGVLKRRRDIRGKRMKSQTKRPAAERIDAFFKPT